MEKLYDYWVQFEAVDWKGAWINYTGPFLAEESATKELQRASSLKINTGMKWRVRKIPVNQTP